MAANFSSSFHQAALLIPQCPSSDAGKGGWGGGAPCSFTQVAGPVYLHLHGVPGCQRGFQQCLVGSQTLPGVGIAINSREFERICPSQAPALGHAPPIDSGISRGLKGPFLRPHHFTSPKPPALAEPAETWAHSCSGPHPSGWASCDPCGWGGGGGGGGCVWGLWVSRANDLRELAPTFGSRPQSGRR